MNDPICPDFIIRFRALPDSVDPAIRLRMLLKTALRRDRLRCISIAEEKLPPLASGAERSRLALGAYGMGRFIAPEVRN